MQTFFPHEKIRETQKDFIEKIQETLNKDTNLIAHCPTGTGKTAAVLSTTLSYALENKKTVIFITPKHTQHKIAIETLQLIKQKHNLDFSVVDLIGKRWMCAQPGVTEMIAGEFYDYCRELTKNKQCLYYLNLKKKDKLSVETESTIAELKQKILHVEDQKEISKKRNLCPFEVACLIAKKSSVIIADYHHIISPSVRGHLLERINKKLSDCIIIIDESHNLPNKCRELLSIQLSSITIDIAKREAHSLGEEDIETSLDFIKHSFEKLEKQYLDEEKTESLIKKEELINLIEENIETSQIINDLIYVAEKVRETKKRSAAQSVANFLMNWEGPDESFIRVIKSEKTRKGNKHIIISYKCLDPSLITRPLANSSSHLLCMSGTLTPLEMYKDLLGFETLTAEFENPFPTKNKINMIVPETTTKYTARSEEMYKKIANYCFSIVNEIPGNSAIFFPSYELRDKVNSYMINQCQKTTFSELPNMNKIEKTELLEKFKEYKNTGAVLLGASTGSFGEGIDIEDNILKCVIIVGIPLERPDIETQELIAYYDKKFGKGWDYGYIMPAIIKCLQNAGRCIRSETDKGVAIFLDQRYIWESYFKCFPKDGSLRISKTPLNRIRNFFNQ